MKSKKVEVVYIVTKLELGGAQKVCLSLLEGLREADHTSALISGKDGPLVDAVHDKKMVYLLPTMQREVSVSAIWQEVKNFFALRKAIKKIKPENPNLIVHTHSTKAGLLGRWAAFFAGVKYRVHTVHGYGFHPHQSKLTWWMTYLLEYATSFITTHFVCVSSADVKTGIKLFPRFARKHSIIRAAVDWEQFYTPAVETTLQDKETFTFGTIACFKPQKNLFDLLKAFKKAYEQTDTIRLEIVGDGILRAEIGKWITTNNLQNVITLHGWQAQVAPFMKSWDAFVLSSLWEGLPCSIVEARLQKLPVLSYNTGGIHDVIMDGENGYLYKQGDWETLADGMIDISTNPEVHAQLKDYPDHLDEFNEAYMVQKHIELYQDLA